MKYDKPIILPIKKIVRETERIKSFYFDNPFEDAKPGQFVMLWIPDYDEIPLGIIVSDNQLIISVACIGEATQALHSMEVGEKVGIRGPYGSSFKLPRKTEKIALVAGGYGVVPLVYLSQIATKKGIDVDIFLGARSKNDLLFENWIKKTGVNLHISTDDGSYGFKGFNTDLFAQYTKKTTYDYVATVGPEIMEYKVAQFCYEKNIPFEVSIERYMKCGIGICGSCCVDDSGWRMCVEGPVINGEKLKKITEFGKYHRKASGKVEYFPWYKKI